MRNPLTLAAVLAALCGSAALADGTVAPGDVK